VPGMFSEGGRGVMVGTGPTDGTNEAEGVFDITMGVGANVTGRGKGSGGELCR